MKKFRFRLQAVLDYRKSIKEDKKKVLVMKNMVLRDRERRLEALKAAELTNSLSDGRLMESREIYLAGAYGTRLKVEIAEMESLIQAARKEVEIAMQAYLEASKELETLEAVKKKKLEEYTEQAGREETNMIDELNVQKAARAAMETV